MPLPATPYQEILADALASNEDVPNYLRTELPYYWREDYLQMSSRPSEMVVFTCDSFDYIFDSYQQQVAYDPATRVPPIEARLVAAIGVSKPNRTKRDDTRIRGLTVSPVPGATAEWDRSNFIAHSIGGTVDGNEANVFLQLRRINRGEYRRMEHYCMNNSGVTCFSRPIYADTSAHPFAVEFGVLKADGQLWVQVMPNR